MPCSVIESPLIQEWRLRELLAGAESVLDFVPKFWPSFNLPMDHLAPLADVFARISLGGKAVRALSSAPPRFGKSTIIGAAIGRHLMLRPQDTVMLVSHSADLAVSKSRLIRGSVLAAGLILHPDQKKASHWRTSAGGGVIACGVGGGILGEGAQLIVLDDIFRGRPEAESETVREHVESWFRGTCLTRLEPNGSVLVNSTRWHVSDLQAVLEDEGGWEQVNIPALNESGQSNWPSRWTTQELLLKKKALGSYDWFSQYMGQPRPPGGAVFGTEPAYYDWPNVETGVPIVSIDPSASASTRADHSVVLVGLGYRDKNGLPCLDVVDVWRQQVQAPQLIAAIKRISERWTGKQPPITAIEAVGGFKVLVPLLRAAGVRRVLEVKATIDKLSRSLPSAGAWESGRIRLPQKDLPWKRDFLREVQLFCGAGGDRADDQVDALGHCFDVCSKTIPHRRRGPARQNIAKWTQIYE